MGAAVAKRQNKVTSKKNDMRPPSQVFDARYRSRLTTQSCKWGPGVTIPGCQKTKRIDGPQPRRMGREQRMCRFDSLEIRRMQ
jgi:hypothetical protein